MLLLKTSLFLLTLAPPGDGQCRGPLTRATVVDCATAASPRLRADRESIAAAEGHAAAARVLLPSNPSVNVTVGQRWNTSGDQALNVTGQLSQPLEIAGQRRARRAAAAADVRAAEHNAHATERDVIADALLAYYDVLAAREEARTLERASRTAQRLRAVVAGRTDAGLAAPLEIDLAQAEAASLRERLALAKGNLEVAKARLASALGLDPSVALPEVRGDLAPIPTPDDLRAASESATSRPEVTRAKAEREARAARVRVLKRERAPSPSLSAFAQTDGFNERIVGGGISFPLPLPFPLGRTNKGKIQAARARTREADLRVDAVSRAVTLEATVAHHEFQARKEAVSAYPRAGTERAERSLADLAGEIEAGRLPVRDALVAQQALLELILRGIESRHALCRASVFHVAASGAAFDGGGR